MPLPLRTRCSKAPRCGLYPRSDLDGQLSAAQEPGHLHRHPEHDGAAVHGFGQDEAAELRHVGGRRTTMRVVYGAVVTGATVHLPSVVNGPGFATYAVASPVKIGTRS
ncbi:MAG: hypothetical protein HC767_13670 [Akkermansiaceae bacterium]|nr:hypothetical protein [Akkermansiaceae bacterium]